LDSKGDLKLKTVSKVWPNTQERRKVERPEPTGIAVAHRVSGSDEKEVTGGSHRDKGGNRAPKLTGTNQLERFYVVANSGPKGPKMRCEYNDDQGTISRTPREGTSRPR